MDFIDKISFLFSIMFNLYIFLEVYKIISNYKIKFSFLKILGFIMLALFEYYSNCNLDAYLKLLVSHFVIISVYKIFFKDELSLTILKFFIIYVVLSICDFLVSSIFLFYPIKSSMDLSKIPFLKTLSTLLTSLILLLLFSIRKFVVFLNKLLNYIREKWSVYLLIFSCLFFTVIVVIAFSNATSLQLKNFIVLFMSIILLLSLCIIMIFQYFKNKHSEEEQESLLSLMSEYEKVLDQEKMNRHDMLNDLIIIKSFKDKTSKEFDNTLNDIIKNYQDNKSQIYSNLYNLPSGLKGIIYCKMGKIKESKINLVLLSSNEVVENFNKLNSKMYYKVCKILGILLDNAIEASTATKNKHVLIDIYLEEKDVVVYIENSFSNPIDINELYKKGFSSKGSNRGYGLYIVNKLVESTELLLLNQYIINNNFITEFKIKTPVKN